MKKMISGLLVCGLFSLVLLQLSGAKEDTEQKIVNIWNIEGYDPKDVELEIALIVGQDGKATSLRYTLSNNSKVILRVYPIRYNENIPITRTPSGKIIKEDSTTCKLWALSGLPQVLPGKSKHWDMNIAGYLRYGDDDPDNPDKYMKTDKKTGKLIPGEYRLSWHIERYDNSGKRGKNADPIVSNTIILTVLK